MYTDLAPVPNSAVEEEILSLTGAGQFYWIGLFRDTWSWSDESMSFFRNWMSKKPDNYGDGEDCMAIDMNNGGLWDDLSCELNLPFVCVGGRSKWRKSPCVQFLCVLLVCISSTPRKS